MKYQTCFTRNYDSATSQKICFLPAKIQLITILLCTLLIPTQSLFAAGDVNPGKTIAFLPFSLSTAPSLGYLQGALTGILISRISSRTGLTAVSENNSASKIRSLVEQGNLPAITTMLAGMPEDHLVTGSLSPQNRNFEILIYLFSKQQATPTTYRQTINSLNEAIPALNNLSIEISDQILNKIPTTAKAKTKIGTNNFQTVHPDRAFGEGLYMHSSIASSSPDNTENEPQQGTIIEADVVALTVGDLNNDSIEDIVLLMHGGVAIYHQTGNTFKQIANYTLVKSLSPHAVNLADFNGNGIQEIYISANSGNRPSSIILEWDGSAFNTLSPAIPFYLRPGLNENGEAILIGQKGGTTSPVAPLFFQLQLTSDGQLQELDTVFVPEGFNLFDFIRLDLNQDGSMEIVGLKQNNQLVVLDNTGDQIWQSGIGYGAGKTFLGDVTRDRAGDRSILYMHSRLIAKDITSDGHPEIIVSQNRVSSHKYLTDIPSFKGTSITALQWGKTGFTTLWETPISNKYTIDYQVSMAPNQTEETRIFSIESQNKSSLLFWKSEKAMLRQITMK